MSRPLLLLSAGLACLAPACRDAGAEAYAKARAKHEALVLSGAAAEAKGFDEVLALLDGVPRDSARRPDADRLRLAITGARIHLRAPLAVAHADAPDLPPEMQAQAAACARLAQLVGTDGGATPQALRALDECRARVERLDSRCREEHDGGHLHP